MAIIIETAFAEIGLQGLGRVCWEQTEQMGPISCRPEGSWRLWRSSTPTSERKMTTRHPKILELPVISDTSVTTIIIIKAINRQYYTYILNHPRPFSLFLHSWERERRLTLTGAERKGQIASVDRGRRPQTYETDRETAWKHLPWTTVESGGQLSSVLERSV